MIESKLAIRLTKEIAKAVCTWGDRCYPRTIDFGEAKRLIRFLRLPMPEARDFVLQFCRHDELMLTREGWAIDDGAAERSLTLALDFLDQASAAAPEPEKPISKSLIEEQPKTGSILEIPPEGVRWTLCADALPTTEEIEEDSRSTPERRIVLQHLVEAPARWLPRVSRAAIDAVRALQVAYPNFQAVIDYYCRDLHLQMRGGSALRLTPVLLLGPPGLGKTQFAKALARALDLHLRLQSMAEVTAGWVLTGSARKWNEATPGVIARHVAACPMGRAPMILFDELDKAHGHYYACDKAVLGLLEGHTAQGFRDENLDLTLDVSPVSYLLTANRTAGVRPEILSRLKVFEIAAPTVEQMPAIVRSIDAALREESPALAEAFEPLDASIIASFGRRAPRDLRRVLRDAYALVAERQAGMDEGLRLTLADLDAVEGRKPMSLPKAKPCIPILVDPQGPWRLH